MSPVIQLNQANVSNFGEGCVPEPNVRHKIANPPYEQCEKCKAPIDLKADPKAWPYLCAKCREGVDEKLMYRHEPVA